ncbi:MAG: hypothetical protein ACT4O4_00955 [Nitrospiraceae bacterium]
MNDMPGVYVPTAYDFLAAKVDSLFAEDERLLADLGTVLITRLTRSLENEVSVPKQDICVLQLNALQSLMASIEIWRRGFPLQVGILLRNVLETISTAGVLNSDEAAYANYKRGNFDSSSSFTKFKHLWPAGTFLGRLYGWLSNEFTHVGSGYKAWQRIPLDLKEPHISALTSMLGVIKGAFILLDMMSELTCHAFCEQPRYWTRLEPNVYDFRPSQETKEWVRRFVSEPPLETGA